MGTYQNDQSNQSHKSMFFSGTPKLENSLQKKQEIISTDVPEIVTENFYNNSLLTQIQKKVINEIDAKYIKQLNTEIEIEIYIQPILEYIINKGFTPITKKEKSMIIQSIISEFMGLGPLQKLIMDNDISEVMVNGINQVYVEKKGQLLLTDVTFRDNEHLIHIIDKIISPLGRRIDESSPMVDARLSDGSRVNAIIPPVSLSGPAITIRKFPSVPLSMDALVSLKSITNEMAVFLDMAVKSKINIIIAGGTGSGKTTFLNVLSSFIPNNERIITIEDAAELQLLQSHVVSLEARPANIEGKGEITIRDLVRNSLRMRPDRIIIGEVRGNETLDMLQAMNTGHNGSLSTLHANSPRDALSRLETMVLYSGIDFPLKAIREQIASAIHLIVYTERLLDGSRKVTHIAEVIGMEGDIILLQDIYYFEKKSILNGELQGEFKKNTIRPKIYDKFSALGINL